jgi:hypothetical protein
MRCRTASMVLIAVGLFNSRTALAQPVSARQRVVLNAVDRDGDDAISLAELEQFLRLAIRQLATRAGLDIAPGSARFDSYIRLQRDATMNHATADGNDTISPAEIAAMESTALAPPFSGTMKDLLPKDAPKPKPQPAWTDRLEDWLDIRNSFLDEQSIAKPAKFTLTRFADDDETVDSGQPRQAWSIDASATLNGFVEWNPRTALYVQPIVGYEAHVNSSKPASDHVVHRVGFETHYVGDAASTFQSHRLRATFDFSTDRTYAAKVYGATVEYTPNAMSLGIGRYLRGGDTFDFRWRPYAGLVWANVSEPGAVDAYKKTPNFTHEFIRLAGELRLGERGLITPEHTIWHGARVDDAGVEHQWQTLTSVDHRLILSMADGKERASIDFSWTIGRDSPGFEKAKKVELALAFKF